jgi:LmbE family N-acetylglucosaminyl deacetylase
MWLVAPIFSPAAMAILPEVPVKPSISALLTAALLSVSLHEGSPSAIGKTLVVFMAHADDESPVAPILSRYAREGVQVHLIIATDGAQGGTYTTIPRGPELARVRADEARCATDALGIHPPILLGFPDGHLGTFTEDRDRLFQLTARAQAELERLRPDVLITWGPDGGAGHPDHRLVSSIATQLVRAGSRCAGASLLCVTSRRRHACREPVTCGDTVPDSATQVSQHRHSV